MNEFEKVDLTALEPRDWDALVSRTLSRVDAVLETRAERAEDPISMIASWRRSVLVAAAVILAVIIPTEIALEIRESREEAVQRLASLSVAAAQGDEPLRGSQILRTIATGSAQ